MEVLKFRKFCNLICMERKKLKSKSKWDKWLLLTWKKAWIMVVAGFVSIMLHNLIYGLFKGWFDARGGDEAFFLYF